MHSIARYATCLFLILSTPAGLANSSNVASKNTPNPSTAGTTKTGNPMDKKEENLTKSKTFFEANKKKQGVVTLPSGLQYLEEKSGSGKTAGPSDFVVVHYRGKLLNDNEFDSSYKRNEPATFAVNSVIPGWTEALQLMKPGAKWTLYIPPNLAYGERGIGPIGPNEALIFDIELISVKPSLDEDQDGVVEDAEGMD